MVTQAPDRDRERLARQVQARLLLRAAERKYRSDPVGFVEKRLGEFIWSKQREVLEAVRDHKRVAVHSCHTVGKSWIASRVVAWWLYGAELGEAFALTTAPTAPQVRAILWREIARAYKRGRLPGRMNQTEWWMQPAGLRYSSPVQEEELVAFGRKPSEYDEAAFQGIHARRVLVVMDEASGVPLDLWTAADTLVSGGEGCLLAIGNPDDPTSHFAEVCRPGSGWHVIHIDGYDSPLFTGEKVPPNVASQLLSPGWVEEKKEEWGEESPLFQSKIRGLFPENAENGVILLSWVNSCRRLAALDEDPPEATGVSLAQEGPVHLGMDVGAGGDETIIRERRGSKAGRTWRRHTPDWADAVGLLMRAINETQAEMVKIDTIGIGWGVVGRARELGEQGQHKALIVPVNVGESAFDTKKFPKLRDQIWWEVGRELSRTKAWDLSDVDDVTISQLIAPRYGLDSAGRVKIEPKLETRQRIGRSPDDADALLLAFFVPLVKKPHIREIRPQWSSPVKIGVDL